MPQAEAFITTAVVICITALEMGCCTVTAVPSTLYGTIKQVSDFGLSNNNNEW